MQVLQKKEVKRDARGRLLPGTSTLSPGRPPIGLGLVELGRAFLERTDRKRGSYTRIRRVIENLYEIAIEKNNKQAVAAANILLTRFYGQPSEKLSRDDAFLLMIADIPEEHKAYLASIFMPNREQIGINPEVFAEDETDVDELPEGVEEAKFEEIPAEKAAPVGQRP